MKELDPDEIARRVSALNDGGQVMAGNASPAIAPRRRQFVKLLTESADSLIEALCVEQGIDLGLAEVDVLTRGFRPSDFVMITGFAHSGKTQLVNTMIYENEHKRILFFSLDDPAEMILAKLVAMKTGISSETLERQVRDGDKEAFALIRSTAQDVFSNLLVVDDVIGIVAMQQAVKEAEEVWGAPPDAIVIDYLEMMPGTATSDADDSNVKQKANDLKKWAKRAPFPIIALHQGTRSNAKPGDPITLLSMGFSGEQQATIVIGTRRKRDRDDLDAWDRQNHQDTITVHVVKNKRPGGRCTHYDGLDFTMEPETGLIRPLSERDRRQLLTPDSATARAERVAGDTQLGMLLGGGNDQQIHGEAS